MAFIKIHQARPGTGRKWATLLFLFMGVLVIILLLLSYFPMTKLQLIVEAPREDRVIYSIPIEYGDVFEMSYLHSVSKQAVQGSFEITETGKIKPLTTKFDSFGPGLPELDSSVNYDLQNGKFVVYHEEDPREEIRLFVAPLTDDRLLLDGKEYPLTTHFESPALLKIYISQE